MVFLFAVLYLLIIFDEANFIFGYSLTSVELFALWGGEGGGIENACASYIE